MRMANRHSQRVRGIGSPKDGSGKQPTDHHCDLLLFRSASADDGQLDSLCGIFGNGDARQGGRQQGDSPRIAELEGRGAVAVNVGFLDCGLSRSVDCEQRHQRIMQHLQPSGDRGGVVGGDYAIGDVFEAIAVHVDQSPASET